MNYLLIRHSESVDDLTNEFGGWNDQDLTYEGKNKVYKKISQIAEFGLEFEIIVSSSLKRASQTAHIISQEKNLKHDKLESIKEWNKYGILTGMNREEAKEKFPEVYENYENDKYIHGAEREEDFFERIRFSFRYLQNNYKKYNNIILVSHGGFISKTVEIISSKRCKKIDDMGMILISDEDSKEFKIKQFSGVKFA
jgi:2,3-bisphosphoglycerate-dependent phosphoglycerate mutase